MLHVDHAFSYIHEQNDLVSHNTNKYYFYVDVIYPLP